MAEEKSIRANAKFPTKIIIIGKINYDIRDHCLLIGNEVRVLNRGSHRKYLRETFKSRNKEHRMNRKETLRRGGRSRGFLVVA